VSNLFRVPLNLLVVGTLVLARDLPVRGILSFCGGWWVTRERAGKQGKDERERTIDERWGGLGGGGWGE